MRCAGSASPPLPTDRWQTGQKCGPRCYFGVPFNQSPTRGRRAQGRRLPQTCHPYGRTRGGKSGKATVLLHGSEAGRKVVGLATLTFLEQQVVFLAKSRSGVGTAGEQSTEGGSGGHAQLVMRPYEAAERRLECIKVSDSNHEILASGLEGNSRSPLFSPPACLLCADDATT